MTRFMSRKRKRQQQRCRRQIRHRHVSAHPCLDATPRCCSRCLLGDSEVTSNLISKVSHILQNHSGIGVKKLELDFLCCTDVESSYLDNWLRMAVTPGIEELILAPPSCSNAEYSFPCSVLSDGRGSSIRKLQFFHCAIRPTADLGCLITLSTLYLSDVRITGSELEIVLSSCPALEQLGMSGCKEIVRLKIPCMLKRLHSLRVFSCGMLKVVECYAPNISNFDFSGHAVQMLGLLPVKSQRISHLDGSRILRYALTKLMSIVPNVEILRLLSLPEVVSTATVRGKFLRLKHLNMSLPKNKTFDYLSLVGFLDASPSLQTFILNIVPINSSHVSVVGDSEQLTQMPERRHDNLKEFKIIGVIVLVDASGIARMKSWRLVMPSWLSGHTSWGKFHPQ
ncbi:hypothetical protein GUJ93_ZPchr0002g24805 [Zizania palustris]|uniref:At1g61320/AtMIF1 LRR domain-containing protein n=1 Tax=Zizania palustris TaxID=103762 RepID=A0A8J5SLJ6_ZIZPA|nr:hypothetical protein GUJ93_ZPchr0002g24805 [Zizania palustris]